MNGGNRTHSVPATTETEGQVVGLLKKAIGGIGLFASQKKSQAEYSGPCQMCHAHGAKLYAYDGKHLCRACLETYINNCGKQTGKSSSQPRGKQVPSGIVAPADDRPFSWDVEFSTACPPINVPPLMIAGKQYTCGTTVKTERTSGAKTVEGVTFYGDVETADALMSAIDEMEAIAGKLSSNLWPTTQRRFVTPLPAGMWPNREQRGHIMLVANPPTKTGKPPKNAVTVKLDAVDDKFAGATWTVDFLADGRVNKAKVFYGGNCGYTLRFKRVRDELLRDKAVSNLPDGSNAVLYERLQ